MDASQFQPEQRISQSTINEIRRRLEYDEELQSLLATPISK